MAEYFAYGTIIALICEYVLESREKVRINDIIVTPVVGIAVGAFEADVALRWVSLWLRTEPAQAASSATYNVETVEIAQLT